MNAFTDQVKEEYPDLADDIIQTYGNLPPTIKVPHRTPAYVLPIILTILMIMLYAGIAHVRHKSLLMPHEDRIADIERKLMEVEGRVDRQAYDIRLLAIMHNENFAVVKKATGIRDIIFINKDWTIDRMPSHLTLTNEEKDEIYKKFVKKSESDDNDSSEEPDL